jgi:hypothetical protein
MSKSTKDHPRVTPEGKAAGFDLASLTDVVAAKLAEEGQPDERCKSCAFKFGTVPNGCLQTQADALKSVIEGVPFLCHQADQQRRPCYGWVSVRLAIAYAELCRGDSLDIKCGWDFSPPDVMETE